MPKRFPKICVLASAHLQPLPNLLKEQERSHSMETSSPPLSYLDQDQKPTFNQDSPSTESGSFNNSNLRRGHTISTATANHWNSSQDTHLGQRSRFNRNNSNRNLNSIFNSSPSAGSSIQDSSNPSSEPYHRLYFDPTSTINSNLSSSNRPDPKFPPSRNNSLPSRYSNRREWEG